jgi:flagellar biosynthesis chaperone FliJ
VSELKASKTAKNEEISRLRDQLGPATAKARKELEAFIQRLDKEIEQKRVEYARHSPLFGSRGDPPEGKPLSEQAKATAARFEKELDKLATQRDEARKKLIELMARSNSSAQAQLPDSTKPW